MGLLDRLRARRRAAPDRLFAVATAADALQTALNVRPAGTALLGLSPLPTGSFRDAVAAAEALARATGAESGVTVAAAEDPHGLRWLVLRGDDVEPLAVAVHAAAGTLRDAGHGDRLLCAVFRFADPEGAAVLLVHLFARATWYPLVPVPGTDRRDADAERRLAAELRRELPLEPDPDRRLPLRGLPR